MLGVASIAAAALQPAAQFAADRRSVLVSAAAATISVALPVNADEAPRVLTDAEMEARVARKMELLRKMGSASAPKPTSMGANGGLGEVLAGSSRSDYNPEAAVNLRSRSVIENTQMAMRKNEEMKKRDKLQKRDDLCEMLGRGC